MMGANGIQALKSPINGSELVPDPATGLLYSEADGLYYMMGANGIQALNEDELNAYISNAETGHKSKR